MRAARVTPDGLTIKEEKFCQEFAVSGNSEAAYLAAYNSKAKNARVDAYRLLQHEHIRARLEKLRAKSEEMTLYDMDAAMREAKEALDLAKEQKNPSAMVSAVQLRSKLAGILIEKREVDNRKSLKDLSDDDLERALMDAADKAGFTIIRSQPKGSVN